jgi:hypothetical protein
MARCGRREGIKSKDQDTLGASTEGTKIRANKAKPPNDQTSLACCDTMNGFAMASSEQANSWRGKNIVNGKCAK